MKHAVVHDRQASVGVMRLKTGVSHKTDTRKVDKAKKCHHGRTKRSMSEEKKRQSGVERTILLAATEDGRTLLPWMATYKNKNRSNFRKKHSSTVIYYY